MINKSSSEIFKGIVWHTILQQIKKAIIVNNGTNIFSY